MLVQLGIHNQCIMHTYEGIWRTKKISIEIFRTLGKQI